MAFTVASCSIDDYDVEHTAIFPMGGQYRIISLTDESGEQLAGKISSSVRYVYLTNTTNNDSDKCWIRIGNYNTSSKYFYGINGKLSCDLSNKANMTFSGTNVENLAGNVASSSNTFTVSGVVVEQGVTCPSGEVTESISLTYTHSLFPGKTYTITGWKYTGWPEDL